MRAAFFLREEGYDRAQSERNSNNGQSFRHEHSRRTSIMSTIAIKRALISVYDKTGIVAFAQKLHEEFGIELVSTGGTAKLLRDNCVPVTMIEEITGWGEMLNGRVKTLHPRVHAAILADRDNPEHMRQLADSSISTIDMVVVNLYPFAGTIADPASTFEDAVEMIDIGGPCLLRAAAKNHKHVLVVNDPQWYEFVLQELRRWDDPQVREVNCGTGAVAVFKTTSGYDGAIAKWLTSDRETGLSYYEYLPLWQWDHPRYGENPHQKAQIFQCGEVPGVCDLTTAEVDSLDVSMSYNNYIDADAALGLAKELTRFDRRPACVFVKHTNACGVGVDGNREEAYRRAYLGDPKAAMGGVLATNFVVDRRFAESVMSSLHTWGREAGAGAFFIEVWVAAGFENDAVELVRESKSWGNRVRLLAVGDMGVLPMTTERSFRSIAGGIAVQSADLAGIDEQQWTVVTKRKPSEAELADLKFAWLVCKHTKSNAISICKDGMLLGNGAGQMSRLMSCRISSWLAKENGHGGRLADSVAASDAFFPFRDGPDVLADAGVRAIIQPGGSKRDNETIAACDERGLTMIMTGTRHFRH